MQTCAFWPNICIWLSRTICATFQQQKYKHLDINSEIIFDYFRPPWIVHRTIFLHTMGAHPETVSSPALLVTGRTGCDNDHPSCWDQRGLSVANLIEYTCLGSANQGAALWTNQGTVERTNQRPGVNINRVTWLMTFQEKIFLLPNYTFS